MRLVVLTDDRCLRVVPHPARPHLVEADISHLARAVAAQVGLLHEGLDPTALAGTIGDVSGLAGEDLPRPGSLENACPGFDPLTHVAKVPLRDPVVHPPGAVLF